MCKTFTAAVKLLLQHLKLIAGSMALVNNNMSGLFAVTMLFCSSLDALLKSLLDSSLDAKPLPYALYLMSMDNLSAARVLSVLGIKDVRLEWILAL